MTLGRTWQRHRAQRRDKCVMMGRLVKGREYVCSNRSLEYEFKSYHKKTIGIVISINMYLLNVWCNAESTSELPIRFTAHYRLHIVVLLFLQLQYALRLM